MFRKKWDYFELTAVGEEERALVWMVLTKENISWTLKKRAHWIDGESPIYTFRCISYKKTEKQINEIRRNVKAAYYAEMFARESL